MATVPSTKLSSMNVEDYDEILQGQKPVTVTYRNIDIGYLVRKIDFRERREMSLDELMYHQFRDPSKQPMVIRANRKKIDGYHIVTGQGAHQENMDTAFYFIVNKNYKK